MSFPRQKELKKIVKQPEIKEPVKRRPTRQMEKVPDKITSRPKPKFIKKGNFANSKRSIKYGTNNNIYAVYVEAHDATYADVYKYVDDIKKQFKDDGNDHAFVNISMKYSSSNGFSSAGFFSVNADTDIISPYDFQDEDDVIEGFWIQVSM